MSGDDRNRAAQRMLVEARALQEQQRLGAALRRVNWGLKLDPPDSILRAKLHRLAAELHQEHEPSYEAAARHQARADELDPAPPPPPKQAHPVDASGLLIALLPPKPANAQSSARSRSGALREWPDGLVASTLKTHFERRLAGASVEIIASDDHPTSQSIAKARAWLAEREPRAVLTLRADRCYCGESTRDGRFSVVWLRIAEVAGSDIDASLELERYAKDASRAPVEADACQEDALTRAAERLIQSPAFESALAARSPLQVRELQSDALHDLFPGLGRRLAASLHDARLLFESGQLEAAQGAFTLALAIDPEDADARVYLAEINSSLSIAAQLDALSGDEASGQLEHGLTPAEEVRINREIAEQQRQRALLLAAMAVVEGEPNLPAGLDVAALQPARIDDPRALGPSLARRHAGDVVEARHLYGPDGSRIARYFVTPGRELPILREEDTSGNGRPDRFTAYRGRERSDVWEDPQNEGRAERHLVYAAGGEQIERADIDSTGDGRIDRRLRYRQGRVAVELRDTNADGRFDVTDHLSADGVLLRRERDHDGDGQVDVRSHYEKGRLVRREVLDPNLARGIRRQGAR